MGQESKVALLRAIEEDNFIFEVQGVDLVIRMTDDRVDIEHVKQCPLVYKEFFLTCLQQEGFNVTEMEVVYL